MTRYCIFLPRVLSSSYDPESLLESDDNQYVLVLFLALSLVLFLAHCHEFYHHLGCTVTEEESTFVLNETLDEPETLN